MLRKGVPPVYLEFITVIYNTYDDNNVYKIYFLQIYLHRLSSLKQVQSTILRIKIHFSGRFYRVNKIDTKNKDSFCVVLFSLKASKSIVRIRYFMVEILSEPILPNR